MEIKPINGRVILKLPRECLRIVIKSDSGGEITLFIVKGSLAEQGAWLYMPDIDIIDRCADFILCWEDIATVRKYGLHYYLADKMSAREEET